MDFLSTSNKRFEADRSNRYALFPAAQARRYALRIMRASLVIFFVVSSACSTLNPQVADVVHLCKRSLPDGHYETLEATSIPKGAIWEIISRDQRSGPPLRFEEYHVIGHPNGYAKGKAPSVGFVLLQRSKDELVFCEVSSANCAPRIIWFKRQEGVGFDSWVLDRTSEEEICVVS